MATSRSIIKRQSQRRASVRSRITKPLGLTPDPKTESADLLPTYIPARHVPRFQRHDTSRQIGQLQSNRQIQQVLAQLQPAQQSSGGSSSLSHAAERNNFWGDRLGWNMQIDRIVSVLQTENLLPALQSPEPELLASGVQKYQVRHGLSDDGILGPGTWRHLQRRLGPETGITAWLCSLTTVDWCGRESDRTNFACNRTTRNRWKSS